MKVFLLTLVQYFESQIFEVEEAFQILSGKSQILQTGLYLLDN